MLPDATFFALVALLIFFAILVYAGVPGKIFALLDRRSASIEKNLNDARALREEAQAILNDYKRKAAEAEDQAAEIVDLARREAEALRAEHRLKLHESQARYKALAEAKIAQASARAMQEVREQAVEVAIMTASHLLKTRLMPQKKAELIAESIKAIKPIMM